MNYIDFEQEIKKIDPRFSITPNMNRRATDGNKVGLNNILFGGANYDLPVVPDEVKEENDPGYFYIFPNGYSAKMWSIPEIKTRLEVFIKQFNSGELTDVYNDKD